MQANEKGVDVGGDANLPASQCAAELEDTINLALGRKP
jgi:hypothetical protein